MARSAAVSVRVEPAVKSALEEAARSDDRTVAQYVERFFQPFVFIIIDQHGCGFSVARDDNFIFALFHTRYELRQARLYLRNWHGFGHALILP